jgi:Domain of unknown function (DUF4145)
MQCAHCGIHHHDNYDRTTIRRGDRVLGKAIVTSHCPQCDRHSMFLQSGDIWGPKELIYPKLRFRSSVGVNTPPPLLADYEEAHLVLGASPKASAALSRRCLQNALNMQGYAGTNLAKQIDMLLAEPDAKKAIGSTLAATVDAIRNFGNFSAHPIDDQTTLQIIEVEPEEAEWCLDILLEIFDHFFERPAIAAAKKAALDAKLLAAGKPASK